MVEPSTMPIYKVFDEFDLIFIASVVIPNDYEQEVLFDVVLHLMFNPCDGANSVLLLSGE